MKKIIILSMMLFLVSSPVFASSTNKLTTYETTLSKFKNEPVSIARRDGSSTSNSKKNLHESKTDTKKKDSSKKVEWLLGGVLLGLLLGGILLSLFMSFISFLLWF